MGVRSVVLWVGVVVGCQLSTPAPPGDDAGAGGSSSGGLCSAGELCAAGGSGAATASGGAPPLVVDDDGAGASTPLGCTRRCSSDLEAVLDCNSVVVDACTDGSACLDAVCQEDACAAAAASQSSMGCDFWVIKPDAMVDARDSCFAAVVANTWTTPLKLEVSWQGEVIPELPFVFLPRGQGGELTYEAYDPAVGVPAGDVAILFLSDSATEGSPILPAACPEAPHVRGHIGVYDTGRGEGFHIRTTEPAAVYSISPYGGGATAVTSASLLLPTSRWDREYIAINPYPKSEITPDGFPSLNILASEDGTTVDILPTVDIVAGVEVDPGYAGVPVSYQLDQGEYLQLSQTEELTGSVVVADKPIALWGAASCMNVPVDVYACDTAHQQLPPVQAMGSEYVGVRHRNREAAQGVEETSPYRVVAAVDGTSLTWEPAPPEGAPTLLDRGDFVEFWSDQPFVVHSQDDDHPFYVGQYMTGVDFLKPSVWEGDPEWVNVVPAQQYLTDYVFFTDPTYPATSLVVVRAPSQDGAFADVFLECEGALSGWQAVGGYEYTRTQLVEGNFQNVGNCSNGIQRMHSDLPFGVTVWGWGSENTTPSSVSVSYAYPAGMGLRSVNEVELPPPVVK